MKNVRYALIALASLLSLVSFDAAAWHRGEVQRFATLPPNALNPEGITVDRRTGELYATGFNPTGAGQGQIYVFDEQGRYERTLTVTNSSSALLGIDFHPDTHALLVLDLGAGNMLEVDPRTGAGTVITSIGSDAGLNALTFDHDGNIYISGSFSGAIYKTAPNGGPATIWKQDALLTTTGYPPFGANGLQFNRNESALFVANTGNDTVIKIVNNGGTAGDASIFTNSINGADGLMLDEHDNVWVCANQADEIVVTDPTGKAIAKLGDFDGVRNGSPVGFLFPASLVRRGDWIYVTNLSLDLRKVPGLAQSVDSQWAAQVTRQTISRIRARIP
jgi:sugar lactone lactonase YvrE